MGTDVHAIWQAKKDGQWVDIPSLWEQNRHYVLFSWLADVRNGYGFAGSATYEPITPISEPRGLPEDWERGEDFDVPIEILDPRSQEYQDEGETPTIWLGDHSHSWLTADEILESPRPGILRQSGVVPAEWFKNWDGKTGPKEWSSWIAGPGVVISEPNEIGPETTHVQIEWDRPDGLDYFVDEVRRLKELHGEVRVVFGFDS